MTSYTRSVERFRTLRQSRLSTFDRCALSSSFEEEYMNGWSTIEQASGTIFHRFAARALVDIEGLSEPETDEDGKKIKPTIPAGTLPAELAIPILEDVLRQEDIDVKCPEPRCGLPIVRREGGRIYCERGHDHSSDFVNLPSEAVKELRWIVIKWAYESKFDIKNLIDVEMREQAPITYVDPDGSTVKRMLTGQLDALFTNDTDDEFVVLDWKSGWGLPGPNDVGFDGYFQQRFYAWIVFRKYPSAQKVTLKEIYVRFGETREATVFRSDMEDVEAELSALALRFDRAHHERNFPPTPGHHCQFCPRPTACPIFPGARGKGVITNAEMAAQVAREITVAEAALKARKEALAAYTGVHGPEEVSSHKGRRVWGHKVINRTARPDKKAMQKALALQRSGVPINWDDLYRTSQGTRFELHTPQPHEDIADEAVDAALMNALEASLPKT